MSAAELVRDRPLVRRIAEREQQADGDGVDVADVRYVPERLELSVRPDAAADAVAALERHERRGMPRTQAIEVRARLPAQVEKMLEAVVPDVGGASAPALEQCVRRRRRPVRETLDVARADRARGGDD